MPKFRKKPIVIEAVQYNNLNKEEIEDFVGKKLKQELESETAYEAGVAPPMFSLIIETLEGDHKAMPNDWIIKGVNSEFYPCKPDIFEKTYDNDHSCDDKCEMNKRLEWEHRAVEILRLLQSNKINEAENYIWRYCKFNKPNDKKNIHKIYVEL